VLGQVAGDNQQQAVQLIEIGDLRMMTQYVAIDNRYHTEFLEPVDGTPEGCLAGTEARPLGYYTPRIGAPPVRRRIVEVTRDLRRLGVRRSIVRLNPEQPHYPLYLAIRQADRSAEAFLYQLVLLYKQ
jgi:hypothetical protein